jgi:hypothetical protein
MKVFIPNLKVTKVLSHLNLSANPLSSQAINHLSQAFRQNRSLRVVTIFGETLSNEYRSSLQEALSSNQTCYRLKLDLAKSSPFPANYAEKQLKRWQILADLMTWGFLKANDNNKLRNPTFTLVPEIIKLFAINEFDQYYMAEENEWAERDKTIVNKLPGNWSHLPDYKFFRNSLRATMEVQDQQSPMPHAAPRSQRKRPNTEISK